MKTVSYKLIVGAKNEAAKSDSSGNDPHDDYKWIYMASVMRMLICINFHTDRLNLHFYIQ